MAFTSIRNFKPSEKSSRTGVGRLHFPWYLREILRTRFFAKVTPSRAASLSPAIARWGVVQLVGHLTVNEDGEGSNPSAPAKKLSRPLHSEGQKKDAALKPERLFYFQLALRYWQGCEGLVNLLVSG